MSLVSNATAANRFYEIEGDVSVQLAPWKLKESGKPLNIALFKLMVPIRFRSNIANGDIVVPQGYVSDLASIPQFAWSIFMASDDPRIELGAWIHDLLYQNHGVVTLVGGGQTKLSRKQCDEILVNEAMVDLLATPFERGAVYQALRKFGDAWPADSFFERFH